MGKMLIIVFSLLPLNLFALLPEYHYFKEEKKEYSKIAPREDCKKAFKDFYARYKGKPKIIWDEYTGLPHSVYDFMTKKEKGSPEQIAKGFLKKEYDLFRIKVDELKLKAQNDRMKENHLYFEQCYKGVKVEGGAVKVHLKDGSVFWVVSDFKPDISIDINPVLSKEDAINCALRELSPQKSFEVDTAYPVILPEGLDYRLCYKVKIWCTEPLGYWIYYVDAISGEVVKKLNDLRFATYGYVYGKIFPLTGGDAMEVRAFPNEYVWVGGQRATTDENGYYYLAVDDTLISALRGPYCWAHNEDYDDVVYYYVPATGEETLNEDYRVEEVTYNWISEGVTTDAGITGDDQVSAPITLPFTFKFYGKSYSSVRICSNGFLSFTSTSTSYQPKAIPNSEEPNAMIAPLWRDLNPSAQGQILHSGTYYSDKFVVTYQGVKNYANSDLQTFQVILYQDGSIVFQYQSVTGGVSTVAGIENETGTKGKALSSIANGKAYKFTPIGQSQTTVDYTVSYPAFSWINTSTSTGITGDDDSKVFSLPFTFNFYGVNYNQVSICSNGFLSFTSTSTSYQPKDIPNSDEPNALIAPFWRDLNPSATGEITYYSDATKFVVTWQGVKNYANSNTQTFQVILKSDGTIIFQYQNITNDVTTVIGIENQDGTAGKAYTGTPSNSFAIQFTPAKRAKGEVTWTWDYPPNNTHCDEVNVFYHINYIHDYYKKFLGFNGMDYQMKATVHYGTNYANAFYNPRDQNIYLGDGDGQNLLQTSRAADVIYHEYTHGVTHHVYPEDALPYEGQSGAMDEAYSDYFPASVTNDPVIGDWVMAQQYQRDISQDYRYPDDWVGEVHEDSKIYSSALWDIREAVGKNIADSIIFASEFYYPAKFIDGRQAIIQADQNLYGGAHKTTIEQIFYNHGIGEAPGGTTGDGDYKIVSAPYLWWNVSASTGVTGDDETKTISLPWNFVFYGRSYNAINVCSNGFLSFTSTSNSYQPRNIPSSSEPNALIAVFWRDLNPSANGEIKYGYNDSVFVVSWENVKNYGNDNLQTFQVVLNKNDYSITMTYKSITTDYTTVIGIENEDGTKGLAYTSGVGNTMSIKFVPVDGASQGVWTDVDTSISTPHNYSNYYDNTWIIARTGADKMKVHFVNFDVEQGYDFVYIYDGSNNQIARYSGAKGNFWSDEVQGSVIKIRLVTDYSVTKYGFDIDKYSYYTSSKKKYGVDLAGNALIFNLSPNPLISYLNLYCKLPQEDDLKLIIYDCTGRIVKRLEFDSVKERMLKIDLRDLRAGVYFVRLRVKDFDLKEKVVKVK